MSGKPLTDCRDFSTPFILVSAVFFGLYIFPAAGIFADMIPGTKMLFFPESGFMYIFNGTFFYAVLMIVSFAGSVLLVRRMKKRSLRWPDGLPLCFVMGIIGVLLVIYTFYEPSDPARRSLISAIIGAILAYAALPACAAYFLNYWGKTCGNISAPIIRVSSAIGIVGLAFLVGLLWYMITYVPPPTSPYHDNFMNFNPADVLIMLVGLFYGAILLPAIGFVFMARGLEYRKIPPELDPEDHALIIP
ncbi:MAG: hypothetical protein ABSB80_03785 [Methanoregula sp.]|uniref:hypothetical protein n=1 Tax=Methanoregula sp. TaxID=2052170 RepID=UPI003D0BBD12